MAFNNYQGYFKIFDVTQKLGYPTTCIQKFTHFDHEDPNENSI